MNRDDIIRMAREAGGYTTDRYPDEWRLDFDDLDRFAALAAAAEREACAKYFEDSDYMMYRSEVARAIRARGSDGT